MVPVSRLFAALVSVALIGCEREGPPSISDAARYAPIAYSSPCARLRMLATPKQNTNPDAATKSSNP